MRVCADHGAHLLRYGTVRRGTRVCLLTAIALTVICDASFAYDASPVSGEAEETVEPSRPRIYLGLSGTYTAIPANSFAIGFRSSFSLVNLTSLSSQTVALSLPITADVSDRLSIYAGVNAYASRSDGYAWTSMIVDSWSAGFQAIALEQKGQFPSVTVQSTFTKSIGGIISAWGTANVVEFGYALDEDETRGILAGIKFANVVVDSEMLRVGSSTVSYLGGYYQWPNNWKLTGRFGVQAFEGASLGTLLQIKPFTLPIIRFDVDRMTDDDELRFGITGEVAWAPSPTFQLTLRKPITLR